MKEIGYLKVIRELQNGISERESQKEILVMNPIDCLGLIKAMVNSNYGAPWNNFEYNGIEIRTSSIIKPRSISKMTIEQYKKEIVPREEAIEQYHKMMKNEGQRRNEKRGAYL